MDGTLTDPKLGITRCIAHALESLQVPVPDMEILESWIGPPIQDSFREILGGRDPALTEVAVQRFRARFSEFGIYENEVYPGIPDALSRLTAAGFRLVLATSKPQPFAIRILDHFNLGEFFAAVYGSSFDGSLSDKGELISYILTSEGLDATNVLMVGDRKHDVIGAAKSGIPCVGVLYGYGTQEELLESGAVALCPSPANLEAVCTAAIHDPIGQTP